ncbi:nucleotide-binding domain-containing protein [Cutaneotrichosporon oleaginosum]|uniref:Nucleotide-binding domain-containing protein n=1 Tax=Cutaneotrichosporon oleaginosum TaxID=879819 RepID=A0A0J0XD11_9TREE|nr:nucleotide-binding domain-containing protein [Cutaneotrichosporon oleaginosum]KLT38951.1 nucleotide-binding domain-containing protein [Cutaneotrichosporon oleaginosum]
MYDALVLGAGVYGLTIATELSNRGLKVAVVARDLPEDEYSTGFASPWAGCNWCTFEERGDTPAAEWDAITFKFLGRLAQEHPNLCRRIPFWDLWNAKKATPWYKGLVFNLEDVDATPSKPLPGGFPHGVKYESYILHAPNYLKHLAAGLRARGVPLIRRRLASLDEAYDLPETGSVDLVVNALALGNKSLLGVEDDKMYPAQGQTVLVKAPLVNTCTMATGTVDKAGPASESASAVRALCLAVADAEATLGQPNLTAGADKASADAIAYIIPRPGPEGHVVCGGTFNKNNYSTLPSLREAERILQACFALDPLLAGPGPGKTWRDIEVVAHNVGLRPAREGGVRLELEKRTVGGAGAALAPKSRATGARNVAVVHAYGPGGTGYQSSVGLAQKAADIVVGHLRAVPAASRL